MIDKTMCLISTDLSQRLVHDANAVDVVNIQAEPEIHVLVVLVDSDGIILAGYVINLVKFKETFKPHT